MRLIAMALLVFLSGCGPKEGVSITSAPLEEKQITVVRSFDPESAGTLKGVVKFDGEAPASKKIPIRGNPECSVFHVGGQVDSEELLTKDGALQNIFVYIK